MARKANGKKVVQPTYPALFTRIEIGQFSGTYFAGKTAARKLREDRNSLREATWGKSGALGREKPDFGRTYPL